MHATKQPHQYKCTIICYTNKESELKLSQKRTDKSRKREEKEEGER